MNSKYDKSQEEFTKMLDSHFINSNAYQSMKENNFEFLEEREKAILQVIGEKIGAETVTTLPSMTTPHTPYTNIRIIRNAIESSRDYLYWIDKYFAVGDLDILIDAIGKTDIKELKILISLTNADIRMRSAFKRFKEEMANKDIISELRVVVDSMVYNEFHDRWLLSRNINYNIMSGDTARTKQYAELKVTKNRPPFDNRWDKSLDIISRWDEIIRYKNHHDNRW